MTTILEPIRAKYDLPALGAAIFTSDGLTEQAAVGVRKRGTESPVTVNDLWHLGSCTKMMTAMVLGSFVAEGKASWDAEVTSFFPEVKNVIEGNKHITIGQILSHQAGWARDLPLQWFFDQYGSQPPPTADEVTAYQWYLEALKKQPPLPRQREQAAKTMLETTPAFPAGMCHYSNMGYIVAAAIVEKISGKPWEDLLKQRLFGPLGMASAGFGGLGTLGKIDQPWPHGKDGKPKFTNGPGMDFFPAVAPAGQVHCTLADWVKFLSDQLRGAEGKTALLPSDIYAQVQGEHAEMGGGSHYGYGWFIDQRDWASGKAIWHSGCNDMNYCVCWLSPNKDIGFLICTNSGSDEAGKACAEVVSNLINYRLAQATAKP